MMSFNKVFSLINTNNKIRKIITVFRIVLNIEKPYKKNYALNSGERQIGTDIKEIRKDHVNRYNLAINLINKFFNQTSNINGMDIFCGNGYGSWLISNETGAFIDSIDGSKEAISCAKKYYGNKKIHYESKFFPFNIKKNYYDFVVSLESVEHIKNDKLFLKELYNSLKNNGILIISTPNMEKQNLTKNPNHFHYRHYYNDEFISLIEEIGFNFIEMYGQDTYIMNEQGLISGILEPDKMEIKKDYNGQFSIFVLKK